MSRLRAFLLFPFVWIFIASYISLYVLFSVLTLKRYNDLVLAPAAHLWSRIIFAMIGIQVRIEGAEHLQQATSRIVIFNHQSALDLLLLTRILPPRSTGITKREFIYIPFINIALWSADYIFLDRSNRTEAVQTLRSLTFWIKEKSRSLLISPEGTRTPTGKLLPFKKGAFRMAIDGQIDLYPVVIAGAYDLLPKTRMLPAQGTITVRCLPPVSPVGWTVQTLDQHVQEVRQLFEQELNVLQGESV